jgi:hypothetical protein
MQSAARKCDSHWRSTSQITCVRTCLEASLQSFESSANSNPQVQIRGDLDLRTFKSEAILSCTAQSSSCQGISS